MIKLILRTSIVLSVVVLWMLTAPVPSTAEKPGHDSLPEKTESVFKTQPAPERERLIDWSQNIARIALDVEKALHPDYILCDLNRGIVGMDDNFSMLSRLFVRAEERIRLKTDYTAEEAVNISCAIYRILAEEGFRYRDYSDDLYSLLGNTVFGYQLARREIDCVTYGLLGLGIAEHLGLPLAGIYMPGHFALRWTLADGETFNLELSIPARCDDSFYISWKEIPDVTLKNGCYLNNLTRQQVIAQQYYSLSLVWERRGQLDQALKAINTALDLYPLFPDAYNLRGIIYRSKGEIDQALDDFDLAIALDNAFQEARINRAHTK